MRPERNIHANVIGKATEDHLLLQDHVDEVHYRNIKLRKL